MKFTDDSWGRETSSMFNFPSSQHSSSPALLAPSLDSALWCCWLLSLLNTKCGYGLPNGEGCCIHTEYKAWAAMALPNLSPHKSPTSALPSPPSSLTQNLNVRNLKLL